MTRVKSAILVSAALRCADKEMIDCVLVHRGDADAGAIFYILMRVMAATRFWPVASALMAFTIGR